MALALPSGFVDCGITVSITLSATAQLTMAFAPAHASRSCRIILDEWNFVDTSQIRRDSSECPPGQYKDVLSCAVNGPSGAGAALVDTVLEYHIVGPCRGLGSDTIFAHQERLVSGEFTQIRSEGPYRLGMTYVQARNWNPNHCDIYDARYQWFCDGNTQLTSSFGPVSAPTRYRQTGGAWGTTQDLAAVPIGVGGLGVFGFSMEVPDLDHVGPGGIAVADTIPCAWIRNMQIKGETPPLDEFRNVDGPASITGSGANITGISIHSNAGGFAKSPYLLRYRLDVTKNGEGTTGAHLKDPYLTVFQADPDGNPRRPHFDFIQCPFSEFYRVWHTSWPRRLGINKELPLPPIGAVDGTDTWFRVDAPWAAGYGKGPWDPADLNCIINATPPRFDPKGAGGEIIPYFPVQGKFRQEVNVHRPGGSKRSLWTAPGGGMTIDESGVATIFHVTDPTKVAVRVLASSWRNWVGLGTGGHGHVDYDTTRYEVTKRNYLAAGNLDDTWGWQHHGLLRSNWSCPAGGTIELRTLGNWLEIGDGHNLDPATRKASIAAVLHPYDRTYHLAAVSGNLTTRLTFPTGTPVPFAHGRVDELRLKFPAAGDWVLHDMALRTQTGVYFKLDYCGKTHRIDYSGSMTSLNGSHGEGEWPDLVFKAHESADYGGGQRWAEPLTDSLGNHHDRVFLMTEWADTYNRKEGYDGAYVASGSDAGIRDTYGNVLFPELCQWLWPVVPYETVPPDTEYFPKASPRCGILRLVNMQEFLIRVDHPLAHGALDVQVVSAGVPAGAGVVVKARKVSTGAIEATGTTNADGYAVVSPVFANTAIEYDLVVDPP